MTTPDFSFLTSILVPIMFVVVLEIAKIARGISLNENLPHEGKNQPYQSKMERQFGKLVTKLPKIDSPNESPSFGHFAALHGLNVVILLYGVFIVGYSLSGSARFILTFAVLLMLAILPYLEISEYESIRRNGVSPLSVKIHAVSAFPVGIIMSLLGNSFRNGLPLIVTMILGAILVAIPFMISTTYFSYRLNKEIKEMLDNEN